MCFAGSALADTLAIRAFRDTGTLIITNSAGPRVVRVEWASSPAGAWRQMAALIPLDRIPGDGIGSGTISVPVPAFYRAAAFQPPTNMALIPGGTFLMGNATNVFSPFEGEANELPQHTVTLRPFLMDRTEVSGMLWSNVLQWAMTNHYQDFILNLSATWKSNSHPVVLMRWEDAVVWCNARSEREGLIPAYYEDPNLEWVFRGGTVAEVHVNWQATGYRLPTEAEWEYAARGGAAGTRFPWTDYTNNISHAKANYKGNNVFEYDLSNGFHPSYGGFLAPEPFTAPVDSMPVNGFGLFHMAGNVSEWCWDWYHPGYYTNSPTSNPRGPGGELGTRVVRGGNWNEEANVARCSARAFLFPGSANHTIGFRCVISQ